MAGLGTSPCGTAPFGLGTPVAAPLPVTGSWGIRWLNPISRDFEIDPGTNQYKQMPEMRHRVFFALAEFYGSSTVRPEEGLRTPEKMGDGFERLQEAAVRQALYHLTDIERVIRVEEVIVTKTSSQRAHTIVSWRDLTTGRDQVTEI